LKDADEVYQAKANKVSGDPGVLLFFVTAARAPFLGPEYASLKARIARAEYRVPLWFSDDLASFLRLIFQVHPAKR
jgi:hypothetical protein